jgi:two-component system, cell cycle response regulator
MRILIADDDFTSRTVLAGVLRKSGHEVVETVDGAAAWKALQQPDAPRLVILDWMMPEMNGPEVVQRVRALQTDRPSHIIMLTSKGEKADIITGLDAGANDYLAKPFDVGELRARVEVGRRMVEMQDAVIESREALAHQATHDVLTGMLNRRAILDRLREELARAERLGESLAVGMCDIDHFKLVNDTYGHFTGDDVLCGLARILEGNLREYDAVGRTGGEEFLVIAPMKSAMECAPTFTRLCARVAASKMPTRSGGVPITISVGVLCVTSEKSVDAVLDAADRALYLAKERGRNCVVYAGEDALPAAASPGAPIPGAPIS